MTRTIISTTALMMIHNIDFFMEMIIFIT